MNYDIKDVLLSITNFCLGSCVYCNLHTLCAFDYDKETSVKDIENLLTDSYLDGMENIHLTGGEPILSPKLWPVCKLIEKYHPNVRVNIPVSGFFPYATYRYIDRIHKFLPQIRVDISLDSTSKSIHEKTRGKGSFEPLMKTIQLLKMIKGLSLQLQLTLMETNYTEIRTVQNFARKMDMGFYLCFPRFGTRFAHTEDKSYKHGKKFIEEIDRQIRSGWCKIRPLNQQIWTCQRAIWEGKKVYHDCAMGLKSIDIDPQGNVYPCMCYYKHQRFGNIKVQSLTDMLESRRAISILRDIEKRRCQPCVMPVCPWKTNFTIEE